MMARLKIRKKSPSLSTGTLPTTTSPDGFFVFISLKDIDIN